MDTKFLERLIEGSHLLYVVAVAAAVIWLMKPLYKGLFDLLSSMAEDYYIEKRLKLIQRNLHEGNIANWLCTRVTGASLAIQKGFDTLYGPPKVQDSAAADPTTPSDPKPQQGLLARTLPYLTLQSFQASMCVAMAYSLGFMLFQQYARMDAMTAWRWALTAGYWLFMIPAQARLLSTTLVVSSEGRKDQVEIAWSLILIWLIGLAHDLGLSIHANLGSWIIAFTWIGLFSFSFLNINTAWGWPFFSAFAWTWVMASVSWSMSICNIVFTFAFIFAISMAGERGADWVLAWIKGTAWGRARTGNTMVVVRMREKFRARVRVRVTALINSSFYLTFGAAYYFHHLWESFFLPPLFTEPMTGWSIGYPEVMAGGFALLGLLCMLSHLWRIKSPRLFSLTWWSVPVVLLVVASLSLRHATSLQLLGQSGANIAPEDIGLYDFLNLLSQAGEGNEEDWTAAHLRSIAVLLLLLILPLINALMDWLSVGFSRAQFAKLTRDLSAGEHQQWPQLRSGLWDLAVDALGAVVFKATVLALLTFWALVINGRGVSFTLQTMTDYWQRIWPLGNLPFDGDVLLQGNELLISLMIATTLVPTLVHGTWVLTVIAFSGVAALTRSVFFAALWQPKLGAAVLSLLCVCALIWGVDLVNQRLDRAKATTTQTMPTASPNR